MNTHLTLFSAALVLFVFAGNVEAQSPNASPFNANSADRGELKADLREMREEANEDRQAQREEMREEMMAERAQHRCERLSSQWARVEGRMEDSRARTQERLGGNSNELAARRAENDAELSEFRESADERRETIYENLEEMAENEDQSAVVLAFVEGHEEAVEIRRVTIDDAIETFREGVEGLAQSRSANAGVDYDTFVDEVAEAYNEAVTSCEAGEEYDRSQLRADLAAARSAYRAARQEARQAYMAEDFAALREAKKTAFDEAMSTYRETMVGLVETLKSSLAQEDITVDLEEE